MHGAHPVLIRLSLAGSSFIAGLFSIVLSRSWFFYVLVLVFLGGVIVLIIYISTLCTNEKFVPLKYFSLVALITACLIIVIRLACVTGSGTLDYFNPLLIFERRQTLSIVFLISYLFITMICIVKLVKFESGPLVKRL